MQTWRELRGESKLAWLFLQKHTRGRLGSIDVHPASVAAAQGSNDSRTGTRLLIRLGERGLIDILDSSSYPWKVYVNDPLEVKKSLFKKISPGPQRDFEFEAEGLTDDVPEEPASVPFAGAPHRAPEVAASLPPALLALLKSDRPEARALLHQLLDRLQDERTFTPRQEPDAAGAGPGGEVPECGAPKSPEPSQTPLKNLLAPDHAPDVEPRLARDVETPMSTSVTSNTSKIPICALGSATSEGIGVSTSGARSGAATPTAQTTGSTKTPGARLTAPEVPPGCEPLEKHLPTTQEQHVNTALTQAFDRPSARVELSREHQPAEAERIAGEIFRAVGDPNLYPSICEKVAWAVVEGVMPPAKLAGVLRSLAKFKAKSVNEDGTPQTPANWRA